MNVAFRTRMTVDEFLAWEARQQLKWEFDGFQPVAMAGGTSEHSALQRNLAISVGGRLRGAPCQFYGSDFKLRTDRTVRYPDGMVICTPVQRGSTYIEAPTVVFEVLSPSSSARDRVEKNREYAGVPSVQRYVMLEQERLAATVFERSGGDWLGHLLVAGDTLALPEIGVSFPLDELYQGVELPPPEEAEAASD
jgi:Uma2 family endonuclease